MRRFDMWLCAAMIAACTPVGASPPEPIEVAPGTVALQIDDQYAGQGIARIYLVRGGGNREPLGSLYGGPRTIIIHAVPGTLAHSYLVIEVRNKYEEFWRSEDLYFINEGECWELTVAVHLRYSSLLPCE